MYSDLHYYFLFASCFSIDVMTGCLKCNHIQKISLFQSNEVGSNHFQDPTGKWRKPRVILHGTYKVHMNVSLPFVQLGMCAARNIVVQ